MTGCSAKGCRNSTVKGYVMKRFPRDPARRNAWALNVKRDGWTPTNASCLCEVHFDDNQWEQQEWSGTPKLKRTAVPTLFCNCSYGKKRSKNVGYIQNANARVMTEHSYGSIQGIDNSLATGHISKGRSDRRGDHQYAISAEEEDKKKLPLNDESKKENLSHDMSCPLFDRPMRKRSSSMDKNNNGDKDNLDSHTNKDSSDSNVKNSGLGNQFPKVEAVFHNSSEHETAQIKQEVADAPMQVDAPINTSLQPDLPTSVRPQILLLIPEHTSVKTEQTVLSTTVSNSPIPKCSSSIRTKADSTSMVATTKPLGNGDQIQLFSNAFMKCACATETVDVSKVKAAERVLARQARLVKQVATLQRQLIQQKRTYEMERDQLLKKFHELEEKFELTKSILRSCVGDDQLTVRVTDNSRGVVWSKKTIQKALQLRSSCGPIGYNAISKLLLPLPSDRTLQRWNQRSRSHEGIFVEIPKGPLKE